MGFLDSIGKGLGKLAATAEEVKALKGDYEHMSDSELKSEYNDLRKRSGDESKRRFMAVGSVLSDRGITLPGG